MSACRRWQDRLGAWFDGEVSPLEAAEVRAHLIDCPGCRAQVAAWRRQREDLGLLQPGPVPDGLVERMALRFEAGLAAEVRGLDRALRLWTAAAAVLLLAGLGLLLAGRNGLLPREVAASPPRDLDRAVSEILNRPEPAPAEASEGRR
ncbi:MAG: hypothetical protein D6702_02995 [Planctomycetota bacterium]|nr:MAG: hypothetical protein D6702_02995 [Planctomycetota bacterium]